MILFLDFDGVLHPADVIMQRHGDEISAVSLLADGHQLFEHADLLADLIDPYPDLKIVLSTSWVSRFQDVDRAKSYLPDRLRLRVVGATWTPSDSGGLWGESGWHMMSRYRQIERYVRRHGIIDWVAIDDDDHGWPENRRGRLICTNHADGIGDPCKQDELAGKIKEMECWSGM